MLLEKDYLLITLGMNIAHKIFSAIIKIKKAVILRITAKYGRGDYILYSSTSYISTFLYVIPILEQNSRKIILFNLLNPSTSFLSIF